MPENKSSHYTHTNTSIKADTLPGDAAHGMPPFLAQALEDALIVTTLITKIAEENNWDNLQAIAKAFEKYENLRRPLMAYVQEATLKRSPHSSEKELQ